MKVLFDQYQRYKNAQKIVNCLRRNDEKFTILEVGANEHKNLEHFLPEDEIKYMDIKLSEDRMNDQQYILGDATDMKFSDNSFDIIIALDVYEHILPERRMLFLKELNRVAKVSFIIGAPFEDKNGDVRQAEERISEAYRVLYGIPHPWLLEHLENGLPNLENTINILEEQNICFEIFSHGDLKLWEQMMYMQIMSDYHERLLLYFMTVSEYYNQTMFSLDYSPHSYRTFIVGDKQKRGVDFERKYVVLDQKIDELSNVFYTLLENIKLNQLHEDELSCIHNMADQLLIQHRSTEEKLSFIHSAAEQMLIQYQSTERNCFAQLFIDTGEGFHENAAVSKKISQGKICFDYHITAEDHVRAMRFDPTNTWALIHINEFSVLKREGKFDTVLIDEIKNNAVNLSSLDNGYFVCENEDAQIIIPDADIISDIHIDMDVTIISERTKELLCDICRKKGEEDRLHEMCLNNMKKQHDVNIEELCKKHDKDFINVIQQKNEIENEMRRELAAYEREKNTAEHTLAEYKAMYDAMENSLCWRMTAPVRFVGDIFSQHLVSRAVQCVKDHGMSYTMKLFLNGGYDKGAGHETISNELPQNSAENADEFNGRIIDYFEIGKRETEYQEMYDFSKKVKFSILVPLYNTPERFLREMIESVQYQTYKNWELCLADGSDSEHSYVEEVCKEYVKKDERILYKKLQKNGGISENTNACIDMASGDYISLFDHDDILHPSALFETMKTIEDKGADYIYTDEATFEGTDISHIITRHCKPDFAIDNLRANNYICHFSSFKKDLLDKAGKFRPEYDGSQDHDLILRLTEVAECICHVPKVLYYWRSHANSVASDINAKTYAIDAAKRAVASHLKRVGVEGEVLSTRAFPTIFRFDYKIVGHPRISIIIPNKDHVDELSKCIVSITTKSTYDNYEIIVIENNSEKKGTESYYDLIQKNEKIKIVRYEGGFNYSKINNFGRKFATGDYLLFLNNDTEVISDDWIEQLLMYAQRKDVGAVGAKLYFPDNTIQHAGVVLGLGADRTAGHIHYGVDKDNLGYMGKLFYAQDVSAVTAACMMVSVEKFDRVGGFDELQAVALNDVDFCLKLRKRGYLNIFNPYAELYHYESKSRGKDTNAENQQRYANEVARFKEKWKDVLEKGDPYFNPNFSLDRADYFYIGRK